MPSSDKNQHYWVFSNNREGYYDNSDWDMATIIRTGKYYFQLSEKNRAEVRSGDIIILRTYGEGYWGECEIAGGWVPDPEGEAKHKIKTGWFPIKKIERWKTVLPFEIVISELSNKNHRLRIARATEEDKKKLDIASRIYWNLGYGQSDGTFFIIENGLEEAVKKNLSQLKLKQAEADVRQQCSLAIGTGRTDLICKDEQDNYVILKLKIGRSSDDVVGQILRYMGYVREKWASEEKKDVRGIILTPDFDEQLRLAAKEAGVKVLRVRLR